MAGLATLAAFALALVALPGWLLAAAWLLAAGLGLQELRRPLPEAVEARADGGLGIALEGREARLDCAGFRRYGPWVLLDGLEAGGRRQPVRVLTAVLGAERRRELGRLLARARPAAPASV